MIIGSSNASTGGYLSIDKRQANHEANLFTDDEETLKTVRAWFDRLYIRSHEISDDMIEEAEEKWRAHLTLAQRIASRNRSQNSEVFQDLQSRVNNLIPQHIYQFATIKALLKSSNLRLSSLDIAHEVRNEVVYGKKSMIYFQYATKNITERSAELK
jgi:hypothetical protein